LKTPFLAANQDSLPVDGQSFPGRVVPAGSLRGFQVLVTFAIASPFGWVLVWVTSAIPASQGFGWRHTFLGLCLSSEFYKLTVTVGDMEVVFFVEFDRKG
jgi:hypothetical protein